MTLAPPEKLDSLMAARNVQLPEPSSQIPSPGTASVASTVLFTVKVAAAANCGTVAKYPTMAIAKSPVRIKDVEVQSELRIIRFMTSPSEENRCDNALRPGRGSDESADNYLQCRRLKIAS